MSFDDKKFMNEKFVDNIDDVPVPELKKYFTGKGSKNPVWKVRQLYGAEIGVTKQAAEKNKDYAAIIAALQQEKVSEKLEALQAIFNFGSQKTNDIAERLHRMTLASIEPKCSLDLAIKICKAKPVAFYAITNKIMELTGEGMQPGKQKSSTGTRK